MKKSGPAGPSAVPFSLFSDLCLLWEQVFHQRGKSQNFPVHFELARTAVNTGLGLCSLRSGIGLLYTAARGVLCLCCLMQLKKAIVGQSKSWQTFSWWAKKFSFVQSWFHLFYRWRSTSLKVWGQRSWEVYFNCSWVTTKERAHPRASHHADFLYLLIFWNPWCFSQAMPPSLGCAILSGAALSTMRMAFHLHLWWLMKLDMCEYNWTSVLCLKWLLVQTNADDIEQMQLMLRNNIWG